MPVPQARQESAAAIPAPDYDAIIIGAGMSGLYQLYRLRELGLEVCVFETGTGVGGTWYWNRYPGARFDSESYSYGYSFSQELLDEWNWTEHFSPQPETGATATSSPTSSTCAATSGSAPRHRRALARGRAQLARHAGRRQQPQRALPDHRDRPALGADHAPHPGDRRLQGSFLPHRSLAARRRSSFEGKRVAVIGTGATGVQTIQEVAKTVGHLTVFQRTPNWCAPLHNGPITQRR